MGTRPALSASLSERGPVATVSRALPAGRREGGKEGRREGGKEGGKEGDECER